MTSIVTGKFVYHVVVIVLITVFSVMIWGKFTTIGNQPALVSSVYLLRTTYSMEQLAVGSHDIEGGWLKMSAGKLRYDYNFVFEAKDDSVKLVEKENSLNKERFYLHKIDYLESKVETTDDLYVWGGNGRGKISKDKLVENYVKDDCDGSFGGALYLLAHRPQDEFYVEQLRKEYSRKIGQQSHAGYLHRVPPDTGSNDDMFVGVSFGTTTGEPHAILYHTGSTTSKYFVCSFKSGINGAGISSISVVEVDDIGSLAVPQSQGLFYHDHAAFVEIQAKSIEQIKSISLQTVRVLGGESI